MIIKLINKEKNIICILNNIHHITNNSEKNFVYIYAGADEKTSDYLGLVNTELCDIEIERDEAQK